MAQWESDDDKWRSTHGLHISILCELCVSLALFTIWRWQSAVTIDLIHLRSHYIQICSAVEALNIHLLMSYIPFCKKNKITYFDWHSYLSPRLGCRGIFGYECHICKANSVSTIRKSGNNKQKKQYFVYKPHAWYIFLFSAHCLVMSTRGNKVIESWYSSIGHTFLQSQVNRLVLKY